MFSKPNTWITIDNSIVILMEGMEYFEETVLGEILNMAMDNCCLQIAAKAKSSSASKSSVSILPEAATEQNEGRPNFP